MKNIDDIGILVFHTGGPEGARSPRDALSALLAEAYGGRSAEEEFRRDLREFMASRHNLPPYEVRLAVEREFGFLDKESEASNKATGVDGSFVRDGWFERGTYSLSEPWHMPGHGVLNCVVINATQNAANASEWFVDALHPHTDDLLVSEIVVASPTLRVFAELVREPARMPDTGGLEPLPEDRWSMRRSLQGNSEVATYELNHDHVAQGPITGASLVAAPCVTWQGHHDVIVRELKVGGAWMRSGHRFHVCSDVLQLGLNQIVGAQVPLSPSALTPGGRMMLRNSCSL